MKKINEIKKLLPNNIEECLLISAIFDVSRKYDNMFVKEVKKIKKDITYILNKKAWAMVVTHNPLGEYGHIHHRLTSQIVSIEATNQNLYYFGKYYKKKHVPHALKKINQKNYDEKMQLIQKYASQKKVMEHLDHMMNHENWVKAKDWRSL